MEMSIFSEIGKDGLRFLKEDIHIGTYGITTISGNPINALLPTNKQSLLLCDRQLGKGASSTVQ